MRIEAHMTRGGKLAVKATADDGTTRTSYFVGGYPYYVISAARYDRSYNRATGWFDGPPVIAISVHKRTRDRIVAEREARRNDAAVFARRNGEYVEVAA